MNDKGKRVHSTQIRTKSQPLNPTDQLDHQTNHQKHAKNEREKNLISDDEGDAYSRRNGGAVFRHF